MSARPRQITDAAILAGARACFLEHGPGVSTGVIAKSLAISQPTLFNRFGTKRELMIAALGPPSAELRPIWGPDAAPDDRPISVQIAEFAASLLAYFDWVVPGYAVLQAAGISVAKTFVINGVPTARLGHLTIVGWLERARAAGRIGPCDPDIIAMMLAGSIMGRVNMRVLAGTEPIGPDDQAYVKGLADALWRALDPNLPPHEGS